MKGVVKYGYKKCWIGFKKVIATWYSMDIFSFVLGLQKGKWDQDKDIKMASAVNK
jgi:hypothetical protein